MTDRQLLIGIKAGFPNVRWGRIRELFQNLGARISDGNNARTRIKLNGKYAVFIEKSDNTIVSEPEITDIRDLLTNAGVI